MKNPASEYKRVDYDIVVGFSGEAISGLLPLLNKSDDRRTEAQWLSCYEARTGLYSSSSSGYLTPEDLFSGPLDDSDDDESVEMVMEVGDDLLDPTCGLLSQDIFETIDRIDTLCEDDDIMTDMFQEQVSFNVSSTPLYDASPKYNIIAKTLLENSRQVVYMDFLSQDKTIMQSSLVDLDKYDTDKPLQWMVYAAIRVKDLVKYTSVSRAITVNKLCYVATHDFGKSFYIGCNSLGSYCRHSNEKFNLLLNPYRKARRKLLKRGKYIFPVSWGLPYKNKIVDGPVFMPRFENITNLVVDYSNGIMWDTCLKSYVRAVWAFYGVVVLMLGDYKIEIS